MVELKIPKGEMGLFLFSLRGKKTPLFFPKSTRLLFPARDNFVGFFSTQFYTFYKRSSGITLVFWFFLTQFYTLIQRSRRNLVFKEGMVQGQLKLPRNSLASLEEQTKSAVFREWISRSRNSEIFGLKSQFLHWDEPPNFLGSRKNRTKSAANGKIPPIFPFHLLLPLLPMLSAPSPSPKPLLHPPPSAGKGQNSLGILAGEEFRCCFEWFWSPYSRLPAVH